MVKEPSDLQPEEIRTTSSTGGQKGVKLERFDLIPVEALQEVARVYGFGAKKYEAHNWRRGYEWSKSYAAMMRHANQFWAGEDRDEETKCHHLASVIFHAMALIVFTEEQKEYDDRYPSIPDDMLTRNQSVYEQNLEAFKEEFKKDWRERAMDVQIVSEDDVQRHALGRLDIPASRPNDNP